MNNNRPTFPPTIKCRLYFQLVSNPDGSFITTEVGGLMIGPPSQVVRNQQSGQVGQGTEGEILRPGPKLFSDLGTYLS